MVTWFFVWTPAYVCRVLAGLIVLSLATFALPGLSGEQVRIKDLGKFKGWRDNALVGYGIVTGLAGTGDSASNKTTRQALANVFSQFNLTIAPEQVQSRNVAVVMVTAVLPPFAREGDTLDVTVTSAGDARSLVGGSLLLTPLKAANGKVYALAQGALSVGGYRHDANGNIVQKNHPTVGAIPNGGVVEVGVSAHMLSEQNTLTFVLAEADYTTASRLAAAINRTFGRQLAKTRDASGVEINVADWERDRLPDFMARLENVAFEPDRRAKVVLDERTGTVVSGGDVKLSKVAISHAGLKISVLTNNIASQPILVSQTGDGVRTAVVSNTQIDVDEPTSGDFVAPSHQTVADLVHALTKLKVSTRDIIAILRAIKTAGALHAELVIQ